MTGSAAKPPKPKLVRENLPGYVGEGHLYQLGDEYYIVFCCDGDNDWDVIRNNAKGDGGGPFVLRGASSRRGALQRLVEAVA